MESITQRVYCGTDGQFCSVGCQAHGEHRDWALTDPWVIRRVSFQVVAVGQTTGTRFPVREPHDSFLGAAWHRQMCQRAFPDETYQIDMTRKDGTVKRNVDGVVDLGYSPEELELYA